MNDGDRGGARERPAPRRHGAASRNGSPGCWPTTTSRSSCVPARSTRLIGENGAGKSTLMRVLYGMYPADGGRIFVRGEEVRIASPRDAIALGIGMVHQHFVLVDPFTVAENIILGDEGGPILDREGAEAKVAELADVLRLPDRPVGDPSRTCPSAKSNGSRSSRRSTEASRSSSWMSPPRCLTPAETADLFENLRRLRDDGKTIVFISHKLDEVLEIADRITVLRRGAVGRGDHPDRDRRRRQLAEMMVGRPVLFRLDEAAGRTRVSTVLRAATTCDGGRLNGLIARGARGRDRRCRRGRGQRPAGTRRHDHGARARSTAGRIALDGTDLSRRDAPHEIRNAGVAFIPEDRHEQGLVLDMTLWENAVIGRQDDDEFCGAVRRPRVRRGSRSSPPGSLAEFDVRARSIDVTARTLSGGNQQKLILARELETDPAAVAGGATHPRARRRGDRVRVAEILEQKADGRGGPADLGRARRDLRAVRPDRHALRGPDHGEYAPDAPAGRGRPRHARRDCRGGGLMATAGAAMPQIRPQERPEWLESLGGQVGALVVGAPASRCSSAPSSSCSTARARSWSTARSWMSRSATRTGSGTSSPNATPLIFSALAVAVCFKGGMFNIGVEGQFIVGDGGGLLGGPEARLPPRPAPDHRRR